MQPQRKGGNSRPPIVGRADVVADTELSGESKWAWDFLARRAQDEGKSLPAEVDVIPGECASYQGRSDRRGVEYLEELEIARFIEVIDRPTETERRSRAKYRRTAWTVVIEDPRRIAAARRARIDKQERMEFAKADAADSAEWTDATQGKDAPAIVRMPDRPGSTSTQADSAASDLERDEVESHAVRPPAELAPSPPQLVSKVAPPSAPARSAQTEDRKRSALRDSRQEDRTYSLGAVLAQDYAARESSGEVGATSAAPLRVPNSAPGGKADRGRIIADALAERHAAVRQAIEEGRTGDAAELHVGAVLGLQKMVSDAAPDVNQNLRAYLADEVYAVNFRAKYFVAVLDSVTKWRNKPENQARSPGAYLHGAAAQKFRETGATWNGPRKERS